MLYRTSPSETFIYPIIIIEVKGAVPIAPFFLCKECQKKN